MSAERSLAHYERISDTPDAIARLRRFVLDLAVRGKLVPQDPNDEPATELLRQIAAERARLAKAGEIKKEKAFPPVDTDADFDIPPTWRWTRLGVVTSYIQRGKSPQYCVSDGSPVVSQKCVQWSGLDLTIAKQVTLESLAEYEELRFLRDGDLLWNSTGTGAIGRVIRLVEPYERLVCDNHVTVVRCLKVAPEYIRIWLRSDFVYGLIEDRATGATNQVELTTDMATNQIVPLPPLAEQRRIVAKVDELMALCDRLEAARTEREARRDRLAAASPARLNAPDPETFYDDARFVLDALPALTSRPDQIKQIRQTILNLAVRGKLVPQDPNDEPASELLKRIAAEKTRLTRAGEIRGDQPLPTIDRDVFPLSAPSGWALTRLATISRRIHYGYTASADSSLKHVRLLRITDIQDNTVDWPKLPGCAIAPEDVDRYKLEKGDILIARTGGPIGKTFLVRDVPAVAIFASYLIRIQGTYYVFDEYLKLFLESPLYWSQLRDGTRGRVNQTSTVRLWEC
jgi:type I restriction enzyme, S subunit